MGNSTTPHQGVTKMKKQNLVKASLVSTVFAAPAAFALDTTDILAELSTAVTDVTAVFGGMAAVIGLMFIIGRIRQLVKA